MDMNVQPVFTNIDADVDCRLRVLFGQGLALHSGLAPHHLSRPSARTNGPSSPTVRAKGSTVPSVRSAGDGHPRRINPASSRVARPWQTCKGTTFCQSRGGCVALVSEAVFMDRTYLSQVIDQSGDAAFGVDQNGLICAWNGGARNLFGYEASDVRTHQKLRNRPVEFQCVTKRC